MANADRIIELLHEAKARPAGAEREQFLAEACRQDSALKEQIVSLLKAEADEGESGFLRFARIIRPSIPPTEKPGDRIGRYKLLEQIGEGGCGVVYMAEQEDPVRRRVALKVIKLGMDTKQVVARFEAEGQALAMMDHPNIAKVLDAGATEAGRPFFVMELVRGIKITDYCDQNNLSTTQRLELFIQVCQAIQHAHQKGIIHRDIKPSNILVTQHDDVAVPKVIDFGIAKATTGQLTDKTVFTAFAQFLGTPAYMSPEQAQMSGLDIDTRADIYSLGVLLYELLTGHTPFDSKELLAAGMDEMRRKIREDEPAKPSTCLSTMQAMDLTTVAKQRHVEAPRLIHLVRGDLDWLVMKCLEKDRMRRYETASALAMDLRRHLNSEPVLACPPSQSYRFLKLVRRNKLAFVATTAITAALVLGLGISTWMFFKEKQARQRAVFAEREQSRLRVQAEANEKRAESQALKSRQVSQFLDDTLRGVGPSIAKGRDTTILRELLDKAAERVGHLTNELEVELELRNTIGTAFREIRQVGKAVEVLSIAPAIARKLWGDESLKLADSLQNLAFALHDTDKRSEAETMMREALTLRKKLLRSDDPAIAVTMQALANTLHFEGRTNEAETLMREVLALRRSIPVGTDDGVLASSLHLLGMMLRDQGRLAEAEPLYRESLVINRKLAGDESPAVAQVLSYLAGVVRRRNKLAEAESMYREALPMCRKLFGDESSEVGFALNGFSDVLRRLGKPAEAEAFVREALALQRKQLGNEHSEVTRTLSRLGAVLSAQGKHAEAEEMHRQALQIRQKTRAEEQAEVADSLTWLAIELQLQGKAAEAETMYRELLALRRKLPANDTRLAAALSDLAVSLIARKNFTEAEPMARESLQIRETNLPDAWQTFDTKCIVGASSLGQKKYAEAEQLLLSGYQGMKQREANISNTRKVRLRENLQLLVQLYEATGQSEKAEEWKKELAEFDRSEGEKNTAAQKQ